MTVMLAVDAETERLARRLAEATGRPLPDVIKDAIVAEAKKAGVAGSEPKRRKTAEERIVAIRAISDRCAALPILDSRTPDEIIGHDGVG
jgi:antitoxin VapB